MRKVNCQVGDLVRYGPGSTALVKLTSPHAGGWHGQHCLGGTTFVYDHGWGTSGIFVPTAEDYKTWYEKEEWRNRS